MSGYIPTPTAQEDLAEIRDYYVEEAGNRVARQMLVEFIEAFRFLARTPGAGHSREDLAEDRRILFWPMRDYLILYKPGGEPSPDHHHCKRQPGSTGDHWQARTLTDGQRRSEA